MLTQKYNNGFTMAFLAVLCVMFACSDDEQTPSDSSNHAPYTPYSPSPQDGSSSRSLDSDLSWECEDPDGDSIYYTLYFSETGNLELVTEEYDTTFYALGSLNGNTTYYWQVVAYDTYGDSTAGPVWTFSTVAESNTAPGEPSYPSPEDEATDQPLSLTLSWTCTDPDYGDYLHYNIYLDTAAVPALESTGVYSESYETGELLPSTWYRWRVVAYDNYGDSTSGPTWSFQTGAQAEGIFAALVIGRMFIPSGETLIRFDEIVARFDSAYAPCDQITPLEADDVSCNEYSLPWNSDTQLHYYYDIMNLSFIDPGEIYIFEVSGSSIMPALTDSIVFPSTEVYITSPEVGDTLSLDGFSVDWTGAGSGSVNLMMISGTDTTNVSVVTDNDGGYTFTADDLGALGDQEGEYGIILVYQNENLIDAAGYDSRSYIRARMINTVTVYLQ